MLRQKRRIDNIGKGHVDGGFRRRGRIYSQGICMGRKDQAAGDLEQIGGYMGMTLLSGESTDARKVSQARVLRTSTGRREVADSK